MFAPTGEGDGFLPGIKGAVIDTGNAGTVAAHVIQHSLDNMRRNLKIIVHSGRDGSPEIM
jgi:hypothetical protein